MFYAHLAKLLSQGTIEGWRNVAITAKAEAWVGSMNISQPFHTHYIYG